MFRTKFAVGVILFVLSMLVPCMGQGSDADLAKAAQNPVASMYSLPFEFTFDYGAANGDATILNIQPVIPVTRGEPELPHRDDAKQDSAVPRP